MVFCIILKTRTQPPMPSVAFEGQKQLHYHKLESTESPCVPRVIFWTFSPHMYPLFCRDCRLEKSATEREEGGRRRLKNVERNISFW